MMNTMLRLLLVISFITPSSQSAFGQTKDDNERLKIAAIEALMSASPERSIPVLSKVMTSNNSDKVKSRALFVLGQTNHPDANAILLEAARSDNRELQSSAIRTIGIGGNREALAWLEDIFETGDRKVKEDVLHAYLIAGDADAVLAAAIKSEDTEVFDIAVSRLGAMGATKQLKQLGERTGASKSLIHAYAISGDTDSLIAIAKDTSNPEQQRNAIHGLGIAGGGAKTGDTLVEIYKASADRELKRAALHGLMVGGFDQNVLTLFTRSDDADEKADLLRVLVNMDSDIAMQAIDSALSEASE